MPRRPAGRRPRPREMFRARARDRGCRSRRRRVREARPTRCWRKPEARSQRRRRPRPLARRETAELPSNHPRTEILRSPNGRSYACVTLYLLHTIARFAFGSAVHPQPTARRSPTLEKTVTGAPHGHGHAHDHAHEELGFWRKYVFSLDHKVIGIQYAITGLLFLLFGFTLMMIMRFQLAYPGHPIPLIGNWFGADKAPGGIMLPEFYNQLGAMHGTIMVFLGVVPLAVGGFGNFVMPLQIGAPEMAFPKLNMMSYWVYFLGGVTMLASFFVPAGAAQSGWTSYPPLSDIATMGQTFWLIGMVFLITSSLLGSVNFIVTIVQLRAKGLSYMRLPFFVWAQLVTAFLLLLAFPPLEAAGILQLMDRLAGTSFFLPSGLVVTNQVLTGMTGTAAGATRAGGGNPILWLHLFWFLAHPEVYVLILPAMGIVSEVIANNTRKPLWGYRALVYSITWLGFMSFIVWAHHMFMTG